LIQRDSFEGSGDRDPALHPVPETHIDKNDVYAHKMSDVLSAVPYFMQHPDLAHAAVVGSENGTNHIENAQGIALAHMMHTGANDIINYANRGALHDHVSATMQGNEPTPITYNDLSNSRVEHERNRSLLISATQPEPTNSILMSNVQPLGRPRSSKSAGPINPQNNLDYRIPKPGEAVGPFSSKTASAGPTYYNPFDDIHLSNPFKSTKYSWGYGDAISHTLRGAGPGAKAFGEGLWHLVWTNWDSAAHPNKHNENFFTSMVHPVYYAHSWNPVHWITNTAAQGLKAMTNTYGSITKAWQALEWTYKHKGADAVVNQVIPILWASAIGAATTDGAGSLIGAAKGFAAGGAEAATTAAEEGATLGTTATEATTAATAGTTTATAAETAGTATTAETAGTAGTEAVANTMEASPTISNTAAQIAVEAITQNAPDVLAAGMKEIANAGLENETSATQVINTVYKLVNAAKQSVATKIGLDVVDGVKNASIETQSLASDFSDAFSNLLKANPELEVSNNLMQAIEEHFTQAAQDIVDQQELMTPFRAGRLFGSAGIDGIDSTVGKYIVKSLGLPLKTLNKLSSSRLMLSMEIGAHGYFGAEAPDAWNKSIHELTIGQSVSEAAGLGKNSTLGGALDFIVNLAGPQFMAGRMLGVGKDAAGIVGDLASSGDRLDRAFMFSARYRNALEFMKNKTAGELMRVFDNMPSEIAEAIAGLDKTAKAKDIHQIFKDSLQAADLSSSVHIPRMGIYGAIKGTAKLSDNAFFQKVSQVFAQMPLTWDEERGIQNNIQFQPTDTNAIHGIGQMLATMKVPNRTITMVLDNLNKAIANGDFDTFYDTYSNVVKDHLKMRLEHALIHAHPGVFKTVKEISDITRKLSYDTITAAERTDLEQRLNSLKTILGPYEKFYNKIDTSINEFVDNRLGGPNGAGTRSAFGSDANGHSFKIDEENPRDAATWFNERGNYQFTTYREFDKEVREMLKTYTPQRRTFEKEELAAMEQEITNIHETAIGRQLTSREAGRILQLQDDVNQIRKNGYLIDATKSYKAAGATAFFDASDWLNKTINNAFFKPLALATPGWAIRVSSSELALNTARLGPINMAAGFAASNLRRQIGQALKTADKRAMARGFEKASSQDIEKELFAVLDKEQDTWESLTGASRKVETAVRTPELDKTEAEAEALRPPPRARAMMTTDGVVKTLGKRNYSVTRDVARNIALFVRGVLAGVDSNLLRSLGHEEFIEAATFIAHQNDSWLPMGVSSSHVNVTEGYDTKQRLYSVGKNGKIVKNRVQYGDAYGPIGFENSAFYEAWRFNANKIASDDLFGNRLAASYQQLIESGLEGQTLHDAIVERAWNLLKTLPPEELRTMERFHKSAKDFKYDDKLLSWAHAAAGSLEGVVLGQDGTLHKELLDAIVHQRNLTDTGKFIKDYGLDKNGKPFPSEKLASSHNAPIPDFVFRKAGITNITNAMHEHFLGPIVNHISRQPTYIVEFVQARKALDGLVNDGIITADQADVKAQTIAAQNMVRYIHNPMDKMRFEENMRVVAPFYFAKNQAFRRIGRLFASNPGAAMQYVASMLAIQNWISKTTAQSGMSVFNIPYSAFLFGLPFTGSFSSMQTVDPFADPSGAAADSSAMPSNMLQQIFGFATPNFGPIITVPAKVAFGNSEFYKAVNSLAKDLRIPEILQLFGVKNKDTSKFIEDSTVGKIGEQTPPWESIMPNSLLRQAGQDAGYKAGWKSFGFDNQNIQIQNQAQLETLSQMSHAYWANELKTVHNQGDYFNALIHLQQYQASIINPGSSKYAEFQQRANSLASNLMATRFAASLFSPVSISVGESDPAQRALYKKMQAKYDTKLSPYAGSDRFLWEHPDFISATTGNTSSVLGNYIPETKDMATVLSNPKNDAILRKYKLGGFAYTGGLAPENKDNSYSNTATQLALQNGLRQRNLPNESLKVLQIALGNQYEYSVIKPIHDAALAMGYTKSQAFHVETGMAKDYALKYNGTWGQQYATKQVFGNVPANEAWIQMQEMASMPEFNTPEYKPVSTAIQIIQPIVKELQGYEQELNSGYGTSGLTYAAVKQWWDNQIQTTIKELQPKHPDVAKALQDNVFPIIAGLA